MIIGSIRSFLIGTGGGGGFQGENYGYTSGGFNSGTKNEIDKFTLTADNDATDVGDLAVARYYVAGQSSADYGYTSGGIGQVDKTKDELDTEKAAAEENRVNSFFYDVDQYMESIFPRNERERLAGAIADPRTPAEAIPMIQAMTDWSDSCWDLYYSLKPDVVAGKDVSFTPPESPSYFFGNHGRCPRLRRPHGYQTRKQFPGRSAKDRPTRTAPQTGGQHPGWLGRQAFLRAPQTRRREHGPGRAA